MRFLSHWDLYKLENFQRALHPLQFDSLKSFVAQMPEEICQKGKSEQVPKGDNDAATIGVFDRHGCFDGWS